jgi:hypothetical protein
VLAGRAFSFTAKPLPDARARVDLVHYIVSKNRMERTVLGGLATRSTLLTSRGSIMWNGGRDVACNAVGPRIGGQGAMLQTDRPCCSCGAVKCSQM